MRIIATVGLPPLLIFVVLVAIMWLPLPGPLSGVSSDVRERVALVLAPFFFVAYLVGVATAIVATFDYPGQALDREMARHDLVSRRQGIFGRSYQGNRQGYPMRGDFQPATVFRPHLLNLYISLAADHRAAIGASRPLLDCRDCFEIQFSEPGLAGLRIFADDESWIRSILASSTIQTALVGLVAGSGGGVSEVYIQPQRIWLHAHSRWIDHDAAYWIPMLLTLANEVASGSGVQQP
jgi:hypothetical protein